MLPNDPISQRQNYICKNSQVFFHSEDMTISTYGSFKNGSLLKIPGVSNKASMGGLFFS